MGSPRGICELEQVVGGADHRPFASDLLETSKQELSEASGIFDLTENGFDDLLAQSITAASPGAFELERYGRDTRAAPPSALTARVVVAVPRSARGHKGFDAAAGQMGEIGIGAEPSVGRELLGIAAKDGARRAEQWLEAARIDRARLHALGNDDLMRAI